MACILILPEILADQNRFEVESSSFDDRLALLESVGDLDQVANCIAG